MVRYVPKLKQGRTVVADLKKRHAKEILVKDVDGDGKDELYVAVEALTKGDRNNVEIVEPVEIRRYDRALNLEDTVSIADFFPNSDWAVDDAYNLFRVESNVLYKYNLDGSLAWDVDLNAEHGYLVYDKSTR